ncbi:MAG: type II secretion system F family protein [Acidimicrobiales bacterium]
MTGAQLAVALGAGLGPALMVVGVLLRGRERQAALAAVLDLPWGERDVPVEAVTESSPSLLAAPIGLAERAVGRFDGGGRLAARLERAHVPLRPGELVVLVASLAVVAGALIDLVTGQLLLGLVALAAAPPVANLVLRRRVAKRRADFQAQLPGALSVVAASLSGGHTFLRAIQMMCEEAAPPLSEEFARVVAETRLGDPLLDSLRRLAARIGVRDLDWVVQAIAIQQSTGGKLADLLHTLTDLIRAREEASREVKALTAENRMSAWVLALLPGVILLAVQVIDPSYLRPLFHGLGLVILAVTALLVVTGGAVIMRMARIEL